VSPAERPAPIASTAMPIPRLDRQQTSLLVVDVQERLMPTILHADHLVLHAGILVEAAQLLGLPIVVTEQYVRGLGATVEPLRSMLPAGTPIVEKTRFSGCVAPVLEHLRSSGRPNVLVCGIEAPICVQQTVLDLLAAGFVPWLVTDAISGSQESQIPIALRRMEGAGAIATGVLSALYELLGDASDPCFRAALDLAKRVRSW
jgi:nicotinamidase-related amidase